jgi:hypothetical protein
MVASVTSLGQVAYDAYCKSTHGRSLISGDRLPMFRDLKPEIQRAWEEAGKAVAAEAMLRGKGIT